MSPLPKCILKVYESEVVAALGNSCLSLIQGVEKHMASAAPPPQEVWGQGRQLPSSWSG